MSFSIVLVYAVEVQHGSYYTTGINPGEDWEIFKMYQNNERELESKRVKGPDLGGNMFLEFKYILLVGITEINNHLIKSDTDPIDIGFKDIKEILKCST